MNHVAITTVRLLLILWALSFGTALAQDFGLDWWTIDGGGATGGCFALGGTIGQLDANTVVMTGGVYTLTGGFWAGAELGPPVFRGDLNCDGRVTFDDINPFVTALIGQAAYEGEYPNCNWLNGDIDCDGRVTFDDIGPFVECLVAAGCP